MSTPRRMSVFLERRSYRRRRMMDALRLLPVFGVMLFMLPIFWPNGAEDAGGAVALSTAVKYVFAAWAVLIAAAFGLWRGLWWAQRDDDTEVTTGEDR